MRNLWVVIVPLVGVGLWAFTQLSLEAYPDISDTQVVVISLYPGHAAEVRRQAWALARQPLFVLFVAAAGIAQACHSFYYGFGTLNWRALGYPDDVQVGTVGPHEVLVQTTAAGLCHSDLHFWKGFYNLGGGKVMGWLAMKGLRGPAAIGSALARLRKG